MGNTSYSECNIYILCATYFLWIASPQCHCHCGRNRRPRLRKTSPWPVRMVPWYRPSNLAAHEHRHWTVPCPWRSDVFGNGGRVSFYIPFIWVTQSQCGTRPKPRVKLSPRIPGSHAVLPPPPKSPRPNSLTMVASGNPYIVPWSFNLSLLHHRHSFRAPTVRCIRPFRPLTITIILYYNTHTVNKA